LFYTAVSTLPVDKTKFMAIRFVLSMSTLLGVLFASFVNIIPMIYYALLGTVIGILLFTIIRHSIPSGKEGKPLSFTIGVIVYTLIIITLNWTFI